jgi:hypothetical protein
MVKRAGLDFNPARITFGFVLLGPDCVVRGRDFGNLSTLCVVVAVDDGVGGNCAVVDAFLEFGERHAVHASGDAVDCGMRIPAGTGHFLLLLLIVRIRDSPLSLGNCYNL